MSDVPALEGPVDTLVAMVAAEVVAMIAATRKTKAKYRTEAEKAMKAAQKGTMKCLPFISSSREDVHAQQELCAN
jgi:hypothetical protein